MLNAFRLLTPDSRLFLTGLPLSGIRQRQRSFFVSRSDVVFEIEAATVEERFGEAAQAERHFRKRALRFGWNVIFEQLQLCAAEFAAFKMRRDPAGGRCLRRRFVIGK